MNFEHSDKCQQYLSKITDFINTHVLPAEASIMAQNRALNHSGDWTSWQVPEQIDLLKQKARDERLWNLFLPDAELGQGLSCLEYAPLAEQTGRSLLAPEIFNCNAPDTGNMEVLYHFGNEAQKEQWLTPLLAGDIRSVFCMTEPGVASSDATNMQATIEQDGDELVLNGTKWWSTGLGHPNAKIAIFMGLSNPDADKHEQHSMVLVPLDTPGHRNQTYADCQPTIMTRLTAMAEVANSTTFSVSKDNLIMDLGKGFTIAQGRLGPGRIHHCMRAIGAAERSLELAIKRGQHPGCLSASPSFNSGGNLERVAQARMAIDQARLLDAQRRVENRYLWRQTSHDGDFCHQSSGAQHATTSGRYVHSNARRCRCQ